MMKRSRSKTVIFGIADQRTTKQKKKDFKLSRNVRSAMLIKELTLEKSGYSFLDDTALLLKE